VGMVEWGLAPRHGSKRGKRYRGVNAKRAGEENGERRAGTPNCAAFYPLILTRQESARRTENRDF
jgi:hypothetical protein